MINLIISPYIKVIKKHQSKAPINLVDIANDLKIKIYSSEEREDLCGKIVKDTNGEYIIFVNSKHSIERQRFTIAHEIAHFVLHQDEIGDGIVDDALYRSGLENEREVEANKLAADILMPWNLISFHMGHHIKSIKELAKIFRVSQSAMAVRLGIPAE